MTFPDHLKLVLSFNPGLLQRDLHLCASIDWTSHFVRQNYDGDWSAIPLRSVAGESHPVRMIYSDPSASEFADTPLLQECRYFSRVLTTFECPLRAVRLMRLTPGSVIKEHTDHDLDAALGMVRIHIPITTNPDVEFELNRVRIDMKPGEVWYLRLADPHRVANKGSEDRVHLVVDAAMNEWLNALFRRSLPAEAQASEKRALSA